MENNVERRVLLAVLENEPLTSIKELARYAKCSKSSVSKWLDKDMGRAITGMKEREYALQKRNQSLNSQLESFRAKINRLEKSIDQQNRDHFLETSTKGRNDTLAELREALIQIDTLKNNLVQAALANKQLADRIQELEDKYLPKTVGDLGRLA